jgi:DNA-binding CsgD family transcriptional regulator
MSIPAIERSRVRNCLNELRNQGIDVSQADAPRLRKFVLEHQDYFHLKLGSKQQPKRVLRILLQELIAQSTGLSTPDMTLREHETLNRLLAGDDEKSAAAALGIKPTTLHVYVTKLYARLGVHSRRELLACCLNCHRTRHNLRPDEESLQEKLSR